MSDEIQERGGAPLPADVHRAALGHFLAPIGRYLQDPTVTEVMINGPEEVWIERAGVLERTPATFGGADRLHAAVVAVAQFSGRTVRAEEPRFDARLPEGHRVHVVLPPLARNGTSVTIRKHSRHHLTLGQLVDAGTLTERAASFLGRAVAARRNLLVSGGTGTGKTTLLNVLSGLIPPGERIVVIEDSAELQVQQEHVVSLEARSPDRKGRGAVTIRDLLHSSLRMRPDRILIGECRGAEALDLLQAMNTGHTGTLTTLHADSAPEALHRLEMLALLGGVEIPLRFLRAQVAAAVHLVVQLQRLGGRRVVQSIVAHRGLDRDDSHRTVEVFAWDPRAERLVATPAADDGNDGA